MTGADYESEDYEASAAGQGGAYSEVEAPNFQLNENDAPPPVEQSRQAAPANNRPAAPARTELPAGAVRVQSSKILDRKWFCPADGRGDHADPGGVENRGRYCLGAKYVRMWTEHAAYQLDGDFAGRSKLYSNVAGRKVVRPQHAISRHATVSVSECNRDGPAPIHHAICAARSSWGEDARLPGTRGHC